MNNPGVQNGVFLGLILIVYNLVAWFINPDLLFNLTLAFIVSLALYVFFMWRAGNTEKIENGGYLTFKQSLKPTFLTYVVGSLIGVIFTYLLYNFIDPTLNDMMLEKSIEMAEKMVKMFGGNEEAVEQAIAEVEKKGASMTIGTIIQNYLVGLIFPGFVLALIVSAIVKKNPPEGAVV